VGYPEAGVLAQHICLLQHNNVLTVNNSLM